LVVATSDSLAARAFSDASESGSRIALSGRCAKRRPGAPEVAFLARREPSEGGMALNGISFRRDRNPGSPGNEQSFNPPQSVND